MFRRSKRSREQSEPVADLISRETEQCTNDIKEKWKYYMDTLHFGEDVALSKIIETFTTPIQGIVQNKYPTLLKGPGNLFWMMIFTAILESETHTKDDVNQAIEELRKKFAS